MSLSSHQSYTTTTIGGCSWNVCPSTTGKKKKSNVSFTMSTWLKTARTAPSSIRIVCPSVVMSLWWCITTSCTTFAWARNWHSVVLAQYDWLIWYLLNTKVFLSISVRIHHQDICMCVNYFTVSVNAAILNDSRIDVWNLACLMLCQRCRSRSTLCFFRGRPVLMECPQLYFQYSSSMRIQDCSRSFDRAQLWIDALFDEMRVYCLLEYVDSQFCLQSCPRWRCEGHELQFH